MTVSFLYSTDIHPVAQNRTSIRSINLVSRNTDERCLAVTKLMLSSMAGAIATTCVLPRVWFKTHTDTLQQRPTSGNERNDTPSGSLGRNTWQGQPTRWLDSKTSWPWPCPIERKAPHKLWKWCSYIYPLLMYTCPPGRSRDDGESFGQGNTKGPLPCFF